MRPAPLAFVAVVALVNLSDSRPVEAGCGVPEPALWSPAAEGKAPLGARITVSLGGFSGVLREVELRPIGGQALAAQRRELPGPVGHTLVELVPDAPLQADTGYELVARRPASWHPNQWVFGAFTTGKLPDAVAPTLGVSAARYLEQVDTGLPARRWIELDVATLPSTTLFAVWLPNDGGRLPPDGAPSVYLPREGDTLRISSPELCGGRHVPLPTALGRAEIALAALDAAGRQSAPARVAIDFAHPTRRGQR
jgi:hypothetical protein